jgi:hypothetical protein
VANLFFGNLDQKAFGFHRAAAPTLLFVPALEIFEVNSKPESYE